MGLISLQQLSTQGSLYHRTSRPTILQTQSQQPAQQPQTYSPPSHLSHSSYSSSNSPTSSSSQHQSDISYYHTSYGTPGQTSGYPSADSSDMMAAARHQPYPPIYTHQPASQASVYNPQSNSPASVASPSPHEQDRRMYGQPQLSHSVFYQGQYPSLSQPPPYPQHGQHQPNMMMSHGQQSMPTSQLSSQPQLPSQAQLPQVSMAPSQVASAHMQQSQMAQSPMSQGTPQMPQYTMSHQAQSVTSSPRHPSIVKMEPQAPPQLQKPQQSSMQPSQPGQNGAPMSNPNNNAHGANSSAAPGPIPATTPLVVRQDSNGVQWIAFEYSRDRVKMEYTIRCDVESINTDDLSQSFKTDNCVYPRACCPKDQYKGNRLVYETECNQVGWALAELNPTLRGKRGLIQRAVDSWRNSNQDMRLRSRRVRRMAKNQHRKGTHQPSQSPLVGQSPMVVQSPFVGSASDGGPTSGIPGSLGPGVAKAGLASMMHHHPGGGHPDASNQPGGNEVGHSEFDHHHHQPHHQTTGSQSSVDSPVDVRPSHVFHSYAAPPYPSNTSAGVPNLGISTPNSGSAIAARRDGDGGGRDCPSDLFPDLPAAKKRKFILVDDNMRGSRLRVRVTLENVNPGEIPDSFRKNSSVYPRSFFPREMQSPPPSPMGSRFFADDLIDDDDRDHVDAGSVPHARRALVKVPTGPGRDADLYVPRMRRAMRGREVRLNDLAYRMAWLQSRVFNGRTVFLQRALDCYRNKTRQAIESGMQEVRSIAPHYETRIGKRIWSERMRRGERGDKGEDE